MLHIPGLGGSSFPGGLAGVPGPAGANGSAGPAGTNGFVLLGSGTMASNGDSFTVSLSTPLTPNKAVLVAADAEIASTANPDFLFYPQGATSSNYSYRFYAGVNLGTGSEARIGRVATGGAAGMRVNITGIMQLNEAGRLHYSGQYCNSTLSQYNLVEVYGTSDTQSSISTFVFASTVSGALAAGSKLSIFQLW